MIPIGSFKHNIHLKFLPVNNGVHHGVEEGEHLGHLAEVVERQVNVELKQLVLSLFSYISNATSLSERGQYPFNKNCDPQCL